MARLRDAEIPVVMVAGNHDAESKLTRSLRFPNNVRVLGTRKPETATYEEIGLAVHGQGFATPAVLDDLSAGYPVSINGLVNVGLLHTSLDGRPGHERLRTVCSSGSHRSWLHVLDSATSTATRS